MKIGSIDRPSKGSLADANDAIDEKLNQSSTFNYVVEEGCQVNLGDLAKGAELGPELTKPAPDDGFEPKTPFSGTKFPW